MNVIVTGATGMVGEGVLRECLGNPSVGKVLVIGRKPSEINHPKIIEFIVSDFFELSESNEVLSGYDACFFCAGVSSVGMDKEVYKKITYDLTLHFASILSKLNNNMTFCYVSGAGTDSTGKSRLEWARVKGKTENDLRKLPFRGAFAFRPGLIQPGKNFLRTNKLYKYVQWLFPVVRIVAPNSLCSLTEIGRAMIEVSLNGYEKTVLGPADIKFLAKKSE